MYVVLVVLGMIVFYSILIANKIKKAKNKVREAFALMDVYLKKRWDLIPKLVETVRGYSTHEINTLEKIMEARNTNYENMLEQEKIEKNKVINENLTKIIALKEAYPNLKANENFLEMQKELVNIENEIANARKYYNGTIRDYNNLVETIPNNIIAKILKEKPKEMFITKEEEKENIEVSVK